MEEKVVFLGFSGGHAKESGSTLGVGGCEQKRNSGGQGHSSEPVWGPERRGLTSPLSSSVLQPPFNVFFEKHTEKKIFV